MGKFKKKKDVMFLFHSCLFFQMGWYIVLHAYLSDTEMQQREDLLTEKWFFPFRKIVFSSVPQHGQLFRFYQMYGNETFFLMKAQFIHPCCCTEASIWGKKKLQVDTKPGNYTLTLDST